MQQQRPGRDWLPAALTILAVIALTPGVGLRTAHAQEGTAVSIVDVAVDPATVEIPVGATVTCDQQSLRVPALRPRSQGLRPRSQAFGAVFLPPVVLRSRP